MVRFFIRKIFSLAITLFLVSIGIFLFLNWHLETWPETCWGTRSLKIRKNLSMRNMGSISQFYHALCPLDDWQRLASQPFNWKATGANCILHKLTNIVGGWLAKMVNITKITLRMV